MTHSFSCKGNKRYRYYVYGMAMKRGWSECPSPSVPTGEIERFVVEQIRTIGSRSKDAGSDHESKQVPVDTIGRVSHQQVPVPVTR
jgi:hypothetical protein